MPSDLIYREDAKDYARHAIAKGLNVLEYLDEVPATIFRPVVRGEWISHDFVDMGKGRYTGSVECPVCHRFLPMKENFCPNCGSDMRPEPPKEGT